MNEVGNVYNCWIVKPKINDEAATSVRSFGDRRLGIGPLRDWHLSMNNSCAFSRWLDLSSSRDLACNRRPGKSYVIYTFI